MNQEPQKIRLWNGAAYRGGEAETQAGAYRQTSGLKKQAGSGAIDHTGAPAGTVLGEGDFALPPADRGAPGAFPFPARPAARSLFSCTTGGGGRRFSTPWRKPVEAVETAPDGGRAARRDGLAAGPSRRPFSAGPEPFRMPRFPVVMLSWAPLMAGSLGVRGARSNSDCLSQGKRV